MINTPWDGLRDVALLELTQREYEGALVPRVWVPETQFWVVTRQPHIRGSGLRGRRVVGRGQGR